MNTSITAGVTDSLPIESEPLHERFILARLEQLTFIFPATLVTEVLIVERSQILSLPFYHSTVLGVIHKSGQIVPLISLRQVVGISTGFTVENLTVIHLGDTAGDLVGLGIVVDMTMGFRSLAQLPPDLFNADQGLKSAIFDPEMRLFQPEIIDKHLWQPQRWQAIVNS